MDPHAVNSAPVLGFLNNVYEGLVRRGKDMAIEPALATSWEPIGDGEGWRFNLREGVTFHNGEAFTAEDVMFSYQRASSEEADTSSWFSPVSEVKVVDDFTIDIMTNAPNPIFPDSIANWMIMDSGWAVENGAERPVKDAENHATLNANGTAAFKLVERQPGLKTVLEPFDGWWGEAAHNVTRAEFTPIQNPATAVAALLSGDVDMINPVPIQDAERLSAGAGAKVIKGIEARVIMLGFPHAASALKYTEDAGKPNPFQDVRVRKAVAHAVNVPAILQTIMRGNAEEASQLVSPAMRGYSTALAARPAFDPDAAKALLAEAGYADGFSFGLKCPNDRYLNDEAVCQAVTGMLAQVGITAELDAMPVRAPDPVPGLYTQCREEAGIVELWGLFERAHRRATASDAVGKDPARRDGLCADVCAAIGLGDGQQYRADATPGQLLYPALGDSELRPSLVRGFATPDGVATRGLCPRTPGIFLNMERADPHQICV